MTRKYKMAEGVTHMRGRCHPCDKQRRRLSRRYRHVYQWLRTGKKGRLLRDARCPICGGELKGSSNELRGGEYCGPPEFPNRPMSAFEWTAESNFLERMGASR